MAKSPEGPAPKAFGTLGAGRILEPSQHGFRHNRSRETALATLSHFVRNCIDNRTETDLVQLDLSNAFDTVDIGLLLRKVSGAGIQGFLLKGLSNLISDWKKPTSRLPRCALGCNERIPSGVRQRLVLGSTLFLIYVNIYVNDMPRDDRFPLVQYADDTSILAPLTSPDTCLLLQDYINNIKCWATDNCLRLSPAKSAVMRFSSGRKVEKPRKNPATICLVCH
ncbi:hypothetical protein ISCGN_003505 [Ixodes scapularis]